MPAACSFEFSSRKAESPRRQLRHAADRARGLAAARPRNAGAFDGHVQRHVLGPIRHVADISARARRLADAGRPQPRFADAREPRRFDHVARGARRLRRPLRHLARAHVGARGRRHAARRRGFVSCRRRRPAGAHQPRQIRRALPSAPLGQGDAGSATATAPC